MKTAFIALLGVLSFLSVSAQNDTLYYQYGNVPVSKNDSFLAYKVISSQNGDGKYNIEEYDKENRIQSKGIYSVISVNGLDTLEGWFTGYDNLNNINREGLYINGNKEDKWKQYYRVQINFGILTLIKTDYGMAV